MGAHSSFFTIFGGVCVFIFGLSIASDNLQKLASNRTRELINRLTRNRLSSFLLGIVLTVLMQSSAAVTSLFVGLGTAGVVILEQVIPIILGATVGTTLTVQLLSLNVAQYGLPLFAASFPIYFLSTRRALRQVMSVMMGFGLVFWGLEMIALSTDHLRDHELFLNAIGMLKESPLVTVALTAFLTALLNSSSATIGFAMTLAGTGVITGLDAAYWVLGANIGTTATALIAATGSNSLGRQIAWAHCFYKIGAAILFFPFAPYLTELFQAGGPARAVANFHTALNVIAALLFFPFTNYGARFVRFLLPQLAFEKEFSVAYLRTGEWDSPSVALAQAEREALRMADIVLTMLRDALDLFRNENVELETSIRERDDRVDLLNREIALFITEHMEGASGEPLRNMMTILNFAADLESAADVIDNNFLDLSRKKHALKVDFSQQGWKELVELNHAVIHVAQLSISCFQRHDKDIASQVVFHKRNIRKLEKRLRESHIDRLVHRQADTLNTTSIHIDLLGEYRRFVGLLANHCYSYLKETDGYHVLPRRE